LEVRWPNEFILKIIKGDNPFNKITKGDKTVEQNEQYVIVRTYSAGVFAGELKSRDGQEVVLTNARRLWYWSGAASLSQLAVEGTSRPESCKFPVAVPEVTLLQAIEILSVTDAAKASIEKVTAWRA
jgi:hypothetical protein